MLRNINYVVMMSKRSQITSFFSWSYTDISFSFTGFENATQVLFSRIIISKNINFVDNWLT